MIDAPPLSQQSISSGAGFGIRSLARLIDAVYGVILGLIGGVLGAIILLILQHAGAIAPRWQHRIQGMSVAGPGLSLLGGFLYHCFSEGTYGASLGKLICQLRVVANDGQPCSLKSAFIRTLAFYFDALFFGLVGYNSMQKSPLNQRYGDVWARTLVAGTKELPSSSRATVTQVLLGVLLGSACWTIMLVLGMVLRAT